MRAEPEPIPEKEGDIPKRFVVPFVAGLIATIFFCGLMIFSQRDRFDATVYLWCGILIAVMFPICIPLAIWQQKMKDRARHKPAFRPWPDPPSNPRFDTQSNVRDFVRID